MYVFIEIIAIKWFGIAENRRESVRIDAGGVRESKKRIKQLRMQVNKNHKGIGKQQNREIKSLDSFRRGL